MSSSLIVSFSSKNEIFLSSWFIICCSSLFVDDSSGKSFRLSLIFAFASSYIICVSGEIDMKVFCIALMHYLSPSINHEEWTNDEDFLLLSAVENIGKRWKLIEKVFKGRTEIDIRNRFYIIINNIKRILPGKFKVFQYIHFLN